MFSRSGDSTSDLVASSGGFAEVLRIALPLILAASSHAINLFIDRVMLSRYSSTTMAAAFPSGLTLFSLSCFFVGTVGYTGSFVAQYIGARRFRRVGVAVWQGIFLALGGGAIMALTGIAAPRLFEFFGHAAEIRELEVVYYRILANGTWIMMVSGALCCFWSGRGLTKVVMFFNFLVAGLNVPFNALLIFGWRGELPLLGVVSVPEFGIRGAALGTLLSELAGMIFLACGFFGPKARKVYATASNFSDFDLFKRLLRFGSPTGVQFFIDMVSFNVFVVSMGRISTPALVASGVVFALNSLAFIPMVGLGQTVSILVGQSIGAKNISHAVRSVASARKLVLIYTLGMSALLLIYPRSFFALFGLSDPEIIRLTNFMLYFVCAYLVFDGFMVVHSNAIKGAGDTKFAMWAGTLMSIFGYALPCLAAFEIFALPQVAAYWGDAGVEGPLLWTLWLICAGYIVVNSAIFYWRYRGGKWKVMRVIEDEPRC